MTNFAYDNLGRVTKVTFPAGQSVTETYTYDAVGNRKTSSAVTYTYDSPSNHLVSIIGVDYTYDADGNRLTQTAHTTPQGIVTTYAWDFENRLTSAVKNTAGNPTTRVRFLQTSP